MDEQQRNDFLAAGKLAGKTRDFGKSLIKDGASVKEILDTVEDFIHKNGGGIAFPPQISLNNIAAHACSDLDDETTIKETDVVKFDTGVHINGMIGDTALTVNLSKEYDDLIKASKDALYAALKLAKPGVKTGEIGEAIQNTITDAGFAPIKNLSGHGLGHFDIHTFPSIPNIKLPESPELEEGMTIAIEPFATTGKGAVADSGVATVFTQMGKANVRSPIARQLLQKITSYQGLPFASRWLARDFGVAKTRLGLKQLEQAGILHSHPPLKEIGNGMVAQYEHSVLVQDKPIITTETEE